MKIISKTYLLISILIAVAIFNLFILYNTQITTTNESYSIIRAGDLKTKVETIAALSSSIANGNNEDRTNLEKEINDFNDVMHTLKNGGTIRGQAITPVPDSVEGDYEVVRQNWEAYKAEASQIQVATIYNKDVVSALNYVLEKNVEMTLTTDSLTRDLEVLDRNYNRHKEVAQGLQDAAKAIGQNALLISIGEEEGVRENLQKARVSFDAGIRKLLQMPLDDLDMAELGISQESLEPIPRENSQSLDELDLLWEAVRLRVKTLETKSLYSEEFNEAFGKLNQQRNSLGSSIDVMLDAWNEDRLQTRNQGQMIIQAVIGVDIAIFLFVLFTIRKSLLPLERITAALSRVKEGIYGEKIEYKSNDEIGDLASSFNIMSETIMVKEEEAKRTDIAKDEFLAMITHELKTPLVPIQGYADILLSGHLGNLTDKQRERISIIKSSSASLLQLISDLLDVQKLGLGQLRMKKESADIKSTVARSIQTLQPQIEEEKISVKNDVVPSTIPHDTDRIAQVLTNLIKNSIRAVTPQSGVIRIYSVEEPDKIWITVQDNGVGIPPDKQEKLFTKFYQTDATLTREKGGSGLGLSICKGIVEAHGGTISLQSSGSGGTTVTFSLPRHESSGKSPV
ncbi:MAG: HAMP domain-containing histidine kinase [Candidatus Nitrosotenuis sp.]|nr:HAMP domain-containing histidine kinase [Candidatus Nitrosotenuis sp.]